MKREIWSAVVGGMVGAGLMLAVASVPAGNAAEDVDMTGPDSTTARLNEVIDNQTEVLESLEKIGADIERMSSRLDMLWRRSRHF